MISFVLLCLISARPTGSEPANIELQYLAVCLQLCDNILLSVCAVEAFAPVPSNVDVVAPLIPDNLNELIGVGSFFLRGKGDGCWFFLPPNCP